MHPNPNWQIWYASNLSDCYYERAVKGSVQEESARGHASAVETGLAPILRLPPVTHPTLNETSMVASDQEFHAHDAARRVHPRLALIRCLPVCAVTIVGIVDEWVAARAGHTSQFIVSAA